MQTVKRKGKIMWKLYLVDLKGKKVFIENFRTKRIALINAVQVELYFENQGKYGLTTIVEK